jgi:hypothetical protein
MLLQAKSNDPRRVVLDDKLTQFYGFGLTDGDENLSVVASY